MQQFYEENYDEFHFFSGILEDALKSSFVSPYLEGISNRFIKFVETFYDLVIEDKPKTIDNTLTMLRVMFEMCLFYGQQGSCPFQIVLEISGQLNLFYTDNKNEEKSENSFSYKDLFISLEKVFNEISEEFVFVNRVEYKPIEEALMDWFGMVRTTGDKKND